MTRYHNRQAHPFCGLNHQVEALVTNPPRDPKHITGRFVDVVSCRGVREISNIDGWKDDGGLSVVDLTNSSLDLGRYRNERSRSIGRSTIQRPKRCSGPTE